jgi:hypothetical protein
MLFGAYKPLKIRKKLFNCGLQSLNLPKFDIEQVILEKVQKYIFIYGKHGDFCHFALFLS